MKKEFSNCRTIKSNESLDAGLDILMILLGLIENPGGPIVLPPDPPKQ